MARSYAVRSYASKFGKRARSLSNRNVKRRRASLYPMSGSLYRRTPKVSPAAMFGTVVPGSTRHVQASRSGHQFPLYVPAPSVQEAHYHATGLNVLAADAGSLNWNITPLNGTISRNDQLSGRSGDSITMKQLALRFTIKNNAASLNLVYAWAIVYSKIPTPTVPAPSEVFEFNHPNALQSPHWRDNYEVLYHSYGAIGGNTTGQNSGGLPAIKAIDLLVKLDNRTASWSVPVGSPTFADMTSGALFFYAITDQTAGALAVEMNGEARVVFAP